MINGRKTFYISLPITGQDMDVVRERCNLAKEKYSKLGWVITPTDIVRDSSWPYSLCMGRCIEALLDSDTLVLLKGWSDSLGCSLEYNAALIYGKEIITDAKI